MKLKSLVLMVVAAGCGLVAMMGVQQVLSGDKQQEQEELVQVLVAVTDIQPGTPLDETNTRFKEWPIDQVPEGSVTTQEQYEERALRVAAVPNEIIMRAKLGEKGEWGVSTAIPEGMRVATVQVNTTKTHSGSIIPGDRVDVVVTYKSKSPGIGMVTKTKAVLEYIKVFATDNIRQGGAAAHNVNGETTEINAKNISLLVTPDQYNLLMLAETKGQLTLALRSAGDDTIADAAAVDDMIFEDASTSHGESDENFGGDEEAYSSNGNNGNVRQFLDEEQQKTEGATVEEAVPPVVPTWTIRVYDGGELREEKVELKEEDVVSETQFDAASGSGEKKSWKGWMKNTFLGGA